jgi:hypothetical protein
MCHSSCNDCRTAGAAALLVLVLVLVLLLLPAGINLWDEHIPDRTLVVLGGKDILSPAAQVDRWLREHTRAHVRRGGDRGFGVVWQH